MKTFIAEILKHNQEIFILFYFVVELTSMQFSSEILHYDYYMHFFLCKNCAVRRARDDRETSMKLISQLQTLIGTVKRPLESNNRTQLIVHTKEIFSLVNRIVFPPLASHIHVCTHCRNPINTN